MAGLLDLFTGGGLLGGGGYQGAGLSASPWMPGGTGVKPTVGAPGIGANALIGAGLALLAHRRNATATPLTDVTGAFFGGAQMDAVRRQQLKQDQAEKYTRSWLKKTYHLSDEDADAAMMNPAIMAQYTSPKHNYVPFGTKGVLDQTSGDVTPFNPSGDAAADGTQMIDFGDSVEGVALTEGQRRKMFTPSQAVDLASGKTITAADGSTYFFGGSGLMRQAGGGGPASTVAPGGVQAPSEAVPAPSTPPELPAAPAIPGGTQLTPPRPGGKVTEDQSKGQTLLTTALPAYDRLVATKDESGKDKTSDFDQLTSWRNTFGNSVGGDAGRMIESGPAQRGADDITTVMTAYVYAVSGAAISEPETRRHLAVVMPSITDKSEAIAAKKDRLEKMVEAIRIKATGGVVPSRLQNLVPGITPTDGGGAAPGLPDLYQKYGLAPPNG